jgi:mediator of RNA polymerase II transcription subunit 16
MLSGGPPPANFRDVLGRFFGVSLPEFRRNTTDPAKLYFASYRLLDVEEDARSLAARRAAGVYVDVFKRVELVVGPPSSSRKAKGKKEVADAAGEKRDVAVAVAAGAGVGEETNGGGNASAGADEQRPPLWRRCVRCASVMEDVWSNRPGFHFVLAQQRKCACGGNWGIVPRGE